MLSLQSHLARHPMLCKTQQRAWAGNEAATRCEPERNAYMASLPAYLEIERIWSAAGDNLRAQIADDYALARSTMERTARAYFAVRGTEHAMIDMERKVA